MKRSEVENTDQTVEGLCNLANQLGYRDPMRQLINHDGSCIGDFLYFLEDNPGACEAIINFVLDHGHDYDGNPLEDEEDEEDDIYCPNCGEYENAVVFYDGEEWDGPIPDCSKCGSKID